MHKTPARISLLSLLINLESHRKLLLKILNEAHVPQDITPIKFGGIINNITMSRHLSFSEEEVPNEARNHNQPLNIVVKCWNYMIARVLIDNGSSLNVMPKTILNKLYCPGAILRSSLVVVKAFDGSKREVMGKITLPICIGPTTFDITFQIHATGVVLSSLHQKVKFVANGQLISVMWEKEIMVTTPFPTDYIEDEEALETSFQALEIVGTTSIEMGSGDIKPSKVAIMAAKVLIANGFEPSKGLGRRLDDMANLVVVQENPGRARIGYSGTVGKAKTGRKSQNKQLARASMYHRFVSGGLVMPGHVAVVSDQPIELVELDSQSVAQIGLSENVMKTCKKEVLVATSEQYQKLYEFPNTETYPQINNVVLAPDDTDKSARQDEGKETKEEALLLEQEKPKLQFGTEELEIINLGKGEETKEIHISKLTPPDFKQRLTELLREYEDIFAWSYRDMLGLDTAIVKHKLPLIPNTIPVRQQLRRMKPKVALKIKEEVGSLAVAKYPQWVANIMLIPKKDRKVQMCVDYRDHNRVSPKDNFPLPHINLLVDNTPQHSFHSFMDGFSGYN
ncbi:hypothetical protein CR513_28211, partial [Mucuna pruriens]